MDYSDVVYKGKDTVLLGVKHFELDHTLECGQCFRWQGEEGAYSGIAHGRRLEILLEGGALILKDVSLDEFESVWKNYFDLGRDYSEIHRRFSKDKTLCEALAFAPGIRVMRQAPWETLITYILSQNSNIPRIKGMVARLCECYGEPLPCGGFTFPEPERLAALTIDDLAPLKCGYRAAYILDAAWLVSEGELELNALYALPVEEARRELMCIRGVGPKVAECVLLYGFGKVECYPLDVWMKRVMAAFYPSGFSEDLSDTAGIAQQFLFHYARIKQ